MTLSEKTIVALAPTFSHLQGKNTADLVGALAAIWTVAWGGHTTAKILQKWLDVPPYLLSRGCKKLHKDGLLFWCDPKTLKPTPKLGSSPGILVASEDLANAVNVLHEDVPTTEFNPVRESWRNDLATQWLTLQVIEQFQGKVVRFLPSQRRMAVGDFKCPDSIIELEDGFTIAVEAEVTAKGQEGIQRMTDGLVRGLQEQNYDAVVIGLAGHFSIATAYRYMEAFHAIADYYGKTLATPRVIHSTIDFGFDLKSRGGK